MDPIFPPPPGEVPPPSLERFELVELAPLTSPPSASSAAAAAYAQERGYSFASPEERARTPASPTANERARTAQAGARRAERQEEERRRADKAFKLARARREKAECPPWLRRQITPRQEQERAERDAAELLQLQQQEERLQQLHSQQLQHLPLPALLKLQQQLHQQLQQQIQHRLRPDLSKHQLPAPRGKPPSLPAPRGQQPLGTPPGRTTPLTSSRDTRLDRMERWMGNGWVEGSTSGLAFLLATHGSPAPCLPRASCLPRPSALSPVFEHLHLCLYLCVWAERWTPHRTPSETPLLIEEALSFTAPAPISPRAFTPLSSTRDTRALTPPHSSISTSRAIFSTNETRKSVR